MTESSRRSFLKLVGGGALAGAVPPSIAKALAIPANHRTGTIADVEHVVILMQENRSFDHYFGTLRGVRGFNDPHVVRLASGRSIWHQPHGSGELLPFRPPVQNLGLTFLPDPPHGWPDTHAAWNGGRMDDFVAQKGITTMTYHTRHDIPFHFALADAFTVCDAYHCSLLGPTDPNRYHLWTGWVGNDGKGGGPVITNAEAGYDWSTYPERLQRNGVTWKIYQDEGDGLDAHGSWGWTQDAYIGNYGDTSLLYFLNYQNSQPGDPLYDLARTGTAIKSQGDDPSHLMDLFRADVAGGSLPQVSWIVAPEAYCEHPNWPADYGAWYVSEVLDALTANPEVWSKTVLFINFDEEGGHFDHMVPPTPAQTSAQGASTVPVVNEIYNGSDGYPAGPYGLGLRVPMIVVSPWSKGGFVDSQVFDHTSVIKFLEARFAGANPDLIEANITPWRRAVTGDLTSCFDFARPNARMPDLPSTEAYLPPDRERHDDYPIQPPEDERMPRQERGLRRARALPYELHVTGAVSTQARTLELRFGNTGAATAVFIVHSTNAADLPRTYTVEPAKHLHGTWAAAAGSDTFDVGVRAPNGFLREYRGSVAQGRAQLEVRMAYGPEGKTIVLDVRNTGTQTADVRVRDRYRLQTIVATLAAGESTKLHANVEASFGWYDIVVGVGGDDAFRQRLAGHVEDGHASVSDPAMAGLLPG
jgi:phospholipase C